MKTVLVIVGIVGLIIFGLVVAVRHAKEKMKYFDMHDHDDR